MRIVKFIKSGWHVLERAYTALWLLSLAGITALPVWLNWETFQHPVLLFLGGALVWAALFLCVLGFYGHRLDQSKTVEARGALRIALGGAPPYETLRDRLYVTERTVKIGVANASSSSALTNCKVILDAISGPLSARAPVPIKTGFVLNPGDVEYLPIARYEESKPGTPRPNDPGDFQVDFPINPLSDGHSYLDADAYELTIVATATGSAAYKLRCRLWVDDGRLRLTEIRP